ncbi:hypothetical protein F9L33_07315 [Amylibacter sp. SFDW26]|uniref:hypothetical protein n=1 Tax=Amylibacter sp. SFDW26 TaxID=2652722 RepID=UPI0012627DAB|nr:hypothetical protein [Amylibacter sp. SFDW26]KAB7614446.1 hypothetical protein F9L33_07315 [Amylibacter sp. SFDW26]
MSDEKEQGQLIISAQCFADANSVIEIAAFLAKTLELRIKAYLLKDQNAFDAADLPFTRAISLSGGSSGIGGQALQKAYNRDAQFYEKTLSRAAQSKALNWSFHHTDDIPETLLTLSSKGKSIILYGFPKLNKSRGNVVLIEEGTHSSPQLNELSKSLAHKLQVQTVFLKIENIPYSTDVLEQLHKTNSALVIMPYNLAKKLGINNILNTARCPVIVSPHLAHV